MVTLQVILAFALASSTIAVFFGSVATVRMTFYQKIAIATGIQISK